MISRAAYDLILLGFSTIQDQFEGTKKEPTQAEAKILWEWTHPYVVVVHRPTGQGYYLDRKYRHIVSVQDISVPTKWVERELNLQASSTNTPDWAEKHACDGVDLFDSYWLY